MRRLPISFALYLCLVPIAKAQDQFSLSANELSSLPGSSINDSLFQAYPMTWSELNAGRSYDYDKLKEVFSPSQMRRLEELGYTSTVSSLIEQLMQLSAGDLKLAAREKEDLADSFLKIIHDHDSAGIVRSESDSLAGSKCLTQGCDPIRETQSDNLGLNIFYALHRDKVANIAAVIVETSDGAKIAGTAFQIQNGCVLTAKHVLSKTGDNPRDIQASATTRRVWLAYGVNASEFSVPLPLGFNWTNRPNTIELPIGTRWRVSTEHDVGCFKVELGDQRNLLLSQGEVAQDRRIVASGFIGPQETCESASAIGQSAYKLGSEGLSLSELPPGLWLGTGSVVFAQPAKGLIYHQADTLQGYSGAPIFDLATGAVVALNSGSLCDKEIVPERGPIEINLAVMLQRIELQ